MTNSSSRGLNTKPWTSGLIWLLNMMRNLRQAWKLLVSRCSLAHLGKAVSIHPTVTFNWPEKIYIADQCKLYRGAYLNARSSERIGIWLGKGVKIHEYSYLDPYGGYIRLDDYSGIGQHCVIGGHGGLEIGKYTMISGLTYIVPANHIFATAAKPYIEQGEVREGIKIGSNVWIGAGCVILDGVTIGDNAVVGAGAVVTRSIPSNALALGVPARVVRELHREGAPNP